MENCKEKFNDYEPLENLKFIIKDGEIICLTPFELSRVYFTAELQIREGNGDPIPENITLNFPQFGNIKLRNYKTLPLYLSENNIFEIKSYIGEIKKMKNLPEVLEDIIGKGIGDVYEIVAKEDDSEKILRQTYNLRDKVNNILDIDNNFRKHGVDKDLYVIEDIFRNDLDLYENKDLFLTINKDFYIWQLPSNLKTEWKTYIDEKLPVFPYENILIAGGHICSFINTNELQDKTQKSDLDLFIYGIKDKEVANRKLEQLFDYFNEIYGIYSLNISKNCISLQLAGGLDEGERDGGLRVDIVLRLYNTKSEILHGFDLGPSAVGWDGEELLFTTLSKFTYEYQTIIVDLSRRSTTYEKRLVKYVNKSEFNIMWYDFNIDKVDDFEKIGEKRLYKMNYMNLEVILYNNEYIFTSIKSRQNFIGHNKPQSLLTQSLLKFNNNDNSTCDYKPSNSNRHNVKCLLNDDLENIYFKITQSNNMKINGQNIIDKIDMNMVKNIDEIINENYLIEHYKKIIINNKFVQDIPNYEDEDNIIKLLCVILNNQDYFIKPFGILRYLVSGKISGRQVPKLLKNLIEQNIQKLKTNIEKINNIDRTMLISWNIQDPTTQLTSSINPLIKDPKDWYGKFY